MKTITTLAAALVLSASAMLGSHPVHAADAQAHPDYVTCVRQDGVRFLVGTQSPGTIYLLELLGFRCW